MDKNLIFALINAVLIPSAGTPLDSVLASGKLYLLFTNFSSNGQVSTPKPSHFNFQFN